MVEKWKPIKIKAVKSTGNAGNIGFWLFISPNDEDTIKTFGKVLNRVENFHGIPLGGDRYVKIQRFEEKGKYWAYLIDAYGDTLDLGTVELHELVEKLQEEYINITTPEEHTFILRPAGDEEDPENWGE